MPKVYPVTYTTEASTETPVALSSDGVPNCNVPTAFPVASHFRAKAPWPPELRLPDKVPLVFPAKYTPEASMEIAVAWSAALVPNCRVQSTVVPVKSYFRRKASSPPELDCPLNVPAVD